MKNVRTKKVFFYTCVVSDCRMYLGANLHYTNIIINRTYYFMIFKYIILI